MNHPPHPKLPSLRNGSHVVWRNVCKNRAAAHLHQFQKTRQTMTMTSTAIPGNSAAFLTTIYLLPLRNACLLVSYLRCVLCFHHCKSSWWNICLLYSIVITIKIYLFEFHLSQKIEFYNKFFFLKKNLIYCLQWISLLSRYFDNKNRQHYLDESVKRDITFM